VVRNFVSRLFDSSFYGQSGKRGQNKNDFLRNTRTGGVDFLECFSFFFFHRRRLPTNAAHKEKKTIERERPNQSRTQTQSPRKQMKEETKGTK